MYLHSGLDKLTIELARGNLDRQAFDLMTEKISTYLSSAYEASPYELQKMYQDIGVYFSLGQCRALISIAQEATGAAYESNRVRNNRFTAFLNAVLAPSGKIVAPFVPRK